MKQLSLIITIFAMLLLSSLTHAGREEMLFQAAKSPNIQSCMAYKDAISPYENSYSKQDIYGAIPYIRTYTSSLGENLNRTNEIVAAARTIGGWQDNYNHYLMLYDEGSTKSSDLRVVMRFRFMGEVDETFYIGGLDSDNKLSKISRIFSSMPLQYEAALAKYGKGQHKDYDRVGVHSTNHRDKQLVLNEESNVFSSGKSVNNVKNLSFTLYQKGTKYTLSYIRTFGSDAVYKITKAELETGQILQFKYNAGDASLARIVDQYGNFLAFVRGQVDPDLDPVKFYYPTKIYGGTFVNSSTDYLSQSITSADIKADRTQIATYTYNEDDWKSIYDNSIKKIYTIASATSINNGTEYYSYVKTGPSNFSNVIYMTGKGNGILNESQFVPSLSRVYQTFYDVNGANRESEVASFWHYSYSSRSDLTFALGAKDKGLKHTAWLGEGGDIDAYDTGKFWKKHSINFYTGSEKNKDFDPMYVRFDGDLDSTVIKYSFSGNPCATYNNVPVKEAQANVNYSYYNYIIDVNGNQTDFTYDSRGRVSTVTEAVGTALERTTTYTYSKKPQMLTTPLKIERPDQTIQNAFNTDGRVIKTTITTTNDGISQVKIYYYQYTDGLLTKTTYPDGSTKTTTYHAMGAKKASETYTKNRKSMTTSFSNYNSAGVAGLITQPNGLTTTITFDDRNRPTSIVEKDPVSGKTKTKTMEYDVRNLLTYEYDSDSVITKYSYNINGILKLKSIAGIAIEYNYNSMAQVISEYKGTLFSYSLDLMIGAKRIAANIYNRYGQLAKAIQGSDDNKYWESYVYDDNANIISITQPGTSTSTTVEQYDYDQLNRKIKYIDKLGNSYNYTYDSLDNIYLQKAANSSRSTSTYNSKELQQEVNTDFGTKSYIYDKVSNPLTIQHQERICNYSGYDVLDYYSDFNCQNSSATPSILNVMYSLDYHGSRFGRLDEVTSNNTYAVSAGQYRGANTYYTYDSFDRVSSKEQRVGRLQTATTVKPLMVIYDYTNEGRLKSITYPSGKTVDYSYTSHLVTGMELEQASLLSLSYDRDLISKITWGNGNSSKYSYDSADNISSIVNVVGSGEYANHSYSYYNNGLVKQAISAGKTYDYLYDAKGQLLSEYRRGLYKNIYTYDNNGNRLSLNAIGTYNSYPFDNATYSYMPSRNRFETIKYDNVSQEFSYLSTGELRLSGSSAYYDYLGRRSKEEATPNGQYAAQYIEYNHKNERVYTPRTGRQYLYDESSHLIGEYDVNGKAIVEYIWLGDMPVASMYPNGKVVYLLTDALSTPRRGIDASNNAVVWGWDPDAFGVITAWRESVVMNLRFPGQYYDKATGLHYNLNRYYNPTLGRYMEADPIGLGGGWNPYAYAANNPVNFVDPSGLVEADLFGPKDDSVFHQGIASYNTGQDKTVLNVGAHANANGIQYIDPTKPKPQLAVTPQAFHAVLTANGYGDMVKRIESGQHITVNFYACNVDNSSMALNNKTFAEKYSKAYPNLTVNAPNGYAAYAANGTGVIGYRSILGGPVFDRGVNTLIDGKRIAGFDVLTPTSPSKAIGKKSGN